MKKLHLCFLLVASSLFVWGCGDDSASNANNENGGSNLPPQQGSEIPCDAGNEGLEIKPADSENPRVCTNGTWVEILSSSSSIKTPEPAEGFSSSSTKTPEPAEGSSSSSIKAPELAEGSSSSSVKAPELAEGSSSSSFKTPEPTEGSSSSSVKTPEPTEGSSSSTPIEDLSSSSEESKMYLCDDGVTYVLDLANCANSSSSSVIQSSSSTKKPEESSSSVMSSSSSTPISSSSSTPIEDPCSSSSSVVSSSSTSVSSSSVQSSSSSVMASSSSSSVAKSSSSVNVSSSSISSSSMMLNSIYDAENNTLTDIRDGHVYKTVTIGTQIWMAENLNYLPRDTSGTFWAGRSICGGGEYQSLQEGDCSVYGRLYEKDINAYDHYNQNICPDGWDVPTLKQWQVLVEFLGGINVAGKAMKSNENRYWPDESLMNEYGFSAIPAGYFVKSKGYNSRNDIGELRAVFTVHSFNSTEKNGIWINDKSDVATYTNYGQGFYLSIRCIKK